MWDSQGGAGESPLPRRDSFTTQRSLVSFSELVNHDIQAPRSELNDREVTLPPLSPTKLHSDLDSQRTPPSPVNPKTSAFRSDRDFTRKLHSAPQLSPRHELLPSAHTDSDNTTLMRAEPDKRMLNTPDESDVQEPTRPHPSAAQGLTVHDEAPRKLLPYSVLERIADSGARSEQWSHYSPCARRDPLLNTSYLPPLTRPRDSSQNGPLVRLNNTRPETSYSGLTNPEWRHGNEDLTRYSINRTHEVHSWYGAESNSPYRSSPYPRRRVSPPGYWRPSISEEEYKFKRYSSYSGVSYGTPSRSLRSYPQSYSYGSSVGTLHPSPPPYSGSEFGCSYKQFSQSDSSFGKHRRNDIFISHDNVKYDPYRRPTSPPREPSRVKHECLAVESHAAHPSLSRPSELNKTSKVKSNDNTQSSESHPKRGGKLPKPITDMLKSWLLEHADHPYPTEEEKRQFCEYTGLDICQISNWVCVHTNVSLSMQGVVFWHHKLRPLPTMQHIWDKSLSLMGACTILFFFLLLFYFTFRTICARLSFGY